MESERKEGMGFTATHSGFYVGCACLQKYLWQLLSLCHQELWYEHAKICQEWCISEYLNIRSNSYG